MTAETGSPETTKTGESPLIRASICLVLTVAVLVVYLQVQGFGFVDLDDNIYVTENNKITAGLSQKGIGWAFTTFHTTNWHPLTWLSLMLDYRLFGLDASGYHFTNVIIHIINSILLFLVIGLMTKETMKSALVALLFAVHPLNVESVAWISERKNLLSTLFWIATTGVYVYYVKSPGWRRYCLALLLFAAGLMTKPMLVTLPVVLLLLDYWPLSRFPETGRPRLLALFSAGGRHLLLEKLPFFVLSVASGMVTVHAASQEGAVKPLDAFPVAERLANAVVAYFRYLRHMVWPANLCCFYPFQSTFTLRQVAAAGLLIAGLTALVVVYARRHRYLAVGWFWYLATLVPVIGLVQVGFQSMADRYAYVPLIGLFVIVAWGGTDLVKRFSSNEAFFYIPAGFAVVAFIALSWSQAQYWRDSETLFQHALNVTKRSHLAHNGMGVVYLHRGRLEEAQDHFKQAIALCPSCPMPHNNLGTIYLRRKMFDDAEDHFQEAARLNPRFVKALSNLGVALSLKGRCSEAISQFQEALRIDPDFKEAKSNLARAIDICRAK